MKNKIKTKSLNPIQSHTGSFRRILAGFRTIVTVDLTFKAPNILEKVFWSLIGISGALWAIYFLVLLFLNNNPLIITKKNVELSEITYPAITICYEGSPKYSVAEQLGNYIDSSSKLPSEFISLRNLFLLCTTIFNKFPEIAYRIDLKKDCFSIMGKEKGCEVIIFLKLLFLRVCVTAALSTGHQ